ncbi:MAG: DNA-3-methyladenine glycosylase [Acidimicrobiales bacterium]
MRGPAAAPAPPPDGRPPSREWLARPAHDLAPDLLGMLITRDDGRVARIVEVEAYGGTSDPASHAYRGPTPRNRTMWGPAGHLYVYRSYGVHWCANVVCGPDGVAGAVLLRAAEAVAGAELMRAARQRDQRQLRDRDLCRGPGRLGRALGLDRTCDGADLVTGASGLWLTDDGGADPGVRGPVAVTGRVGLSRAADTPWRFLLVRSPAVSGRRP